MQRLKISQRPHCKTLFEAFFSFFIISEVEVVRLISWLEGFLSDLRSFATHLHFSLVRAPTHIHTHARPRVNTLAHPHAHKDRLVNTIFFCQTLDPSMFWRDQNISQNHKKSLDWLFLIFCCCNEAIDASFVSPLIYCFFNCIPMP